MLAQNRRGLTVLLLALGATAALPAAPAWAFSQGTLLSPNGGEASNFSDPDNQVTSGQKSTNSFGSNGPSLQFGIQQGPFTSGSQFRSNGFNSNNGDSSSALDPYTHPGGKFGN